jgi:hypothetical protein
MGVNPINKQVNNQLASLQELEPEFNKKHLRQPFQRLKALREVGPIQGRQRQIIAVEHEFRVRGPVYLH